MNSLIAIQPPFTTSHRGIEAEVPVLFRSAPPPPHVGGNPFRARFRIAVLFAVATLACPLMKANAQNTNPVSATTFRWSATRGAEISYLLYLPKGYDAKSAKRWPLMLFLHGAGERGTDVNRVGVHGPIKLAKQGREFPFIIVAPQCPENRQWDDEGLLHLLDYAVATYAVDTNRIYLTGLSMGGYGTWQLALSHPERFAAIAPICGGANMIDVMLGSSARRGDLVSLPIWAFHGAKDNVVPLNESQRVVDALRKFGVKEIKFTIYPEAQHDSWSETYNNPEFYEWLLKQSRSKPRRRTARRRSSGGRQS